MLPVLMSSTEPATSLFESGLIALAPNINERWVLICRHIRCPSPPLAKSRTKIHRAFCLRLLDLSFYMPALRAGSLMVKRGAHNTLSVGSIPARPISERINAMTTKKCGKPKRPRNPHAAALASPLFRARILPVKRADVSTRRKGYLRRHLAVADSPCAGSLLSIG